MASTETHTLEVVQSTADADKRAILHADRTDFEHLDKVVRDGLKTFIDVGNALLEIRQRELWRAGGHATWAAYCQQVGGFTKIHANRLIKGSLLAKQLAQVKPAGFRSEAITPRSEWQIRPLYRLEDDRQRAEAWHRAIERAGGQPTAEMVQEAAIEIGGSAPSEENPKPNRKQLLVETFGRLRASILSRKPSKDIEVLISELERLLKLT